ncbi:MAG: hypothetical protein J6T73_00335 [Clostridia bacterium]|nr:hypothetical protein [Clostridia bacterium]
MDIARLDDNFKTGDNFKKNGLVYYSVDKLPIKLYGLIRENGVYRRMPRAVAESVSEGVACLNDASSGGRVRFITDSPIVAISVVYSGVARNPHQSLLGSAGLDMYEETENDATHVFSFIPPLDIENELNAQKEFPDSRERHLLINLPTYSGVREMYVGIKEGFSVLPPKDYDIRKPVVFYGSSITQGACASRPGNTYQAILSRRLGFDYVNLGFSGNAKGETQIAEYISKLDMSAFIYDYDYNAPSIEHLLNTHKNMFGVIRKANPDLPILILSRPNSHLNYDEIKRREVIKETYESAIKIGDKNVYFIPGNELIQPMCEETALVDYAHPNDSGFVSMAEVMKDTLRKMLGGR